MEKRVYEVNERGEVVRMFSVSGLSAVTRKAIIAEQIRASEKEARKEVYIHEIFNKEI